MSNARVHADIEVECWRWPPEWSQQGAALWWSSAEYLQAHTAHEAQRCLKSVHWIFLEKKDSGNFLSVLQSILRTKICTRSWWMTSGFGSDQKYTKFRFPLVRLEGSTHLSFPLFPDLVYFLVQSSCSSLQTHKHINIKEEKQTHKWCAGTYSRTSTRCSYLRNTAINQ